VELDDNEPERGHGDRPLVGHTDGHGDLHFHKSNDGQKHVGHEEIDIVRQTTGHGKTENKERHRYEHVDRQEDGLGHNNDDEHQGEAEHDEARHHKNRINRADRLEDNFRPIQPLNGRQILDIDTSVKHFKESKFVDNTESSIAQRLHGSGLTYLQDKDSELTFRQGYEGKEEYTSVDPLANHRQFNHSYGLTENSGKVDNDGNDVTFIHTSGKGESVVHKTGRIGYTIHRAGSAIHNAGRDGNLVFRTGVKSRRYQRNEEDTIQSLSLTVLIFCLVIILEPIL